MKAGSGHVQRDKSRQTMTDRLEQMLRTDVLTGVLPPGMRIKPTHLAPSYGVSVTPFREVLERLAAQGLVQTDPYVGARVAAISDEEVEDIYDARLLLEGEALRRSIRHGDQAWEKEVTVAFEALRHASQQPPPADAETRRRAILAWLEVHRRFHWSLISACGSPWLLRLLKPLYDQLDRYAAFAWTEQGLQETSLREHMVMFETALSRNERDAINALRNHLTSSVAWILAVTRANL